MIRVNTNAEELAAQVARYGGNVLGIFKRVFDAWSRATNNLLRIEAESPVKGGLKARSTVEGGKAMAVFECASLIGLWREQGTGVFGPSQTPIVSKGGMYLGPKPAYLGPRRKSGAKVRGVGAERPLRTRKMLHFEIDGVEFFRASVKGRPADPWFWKTIEAAVERPGTGLVARIRDALFSEWMKLRQRAGR